MKFTINGYRQDRLVALECDAQDALLLRWLDDFHRTGKMKTKELSGVSYFWIDYRYLLEDLPILKAKHRGSVGRYLQKLSSRGLIKLKVVPLGKLKGTATYFAFGSEYHSLEPTKLSPVTDGDDRSVASNGFRDDKTVESDPSTKEKRRQSSEDSAPAPAKGTSRIDRWKGQMRDCSEAYRRRYGVGLCVTRAEEIRRAFTELDADDLIVPAFRQYLADDGTKGYLAKEKHPWRIFLSGISQYAAKACDGGSSKIERQAQLTREGKSV